MEMYLIVQLINISFWATLALIIAAHDLSDRRYSVWWGIILLFRGDKKPLLRTLRNKNYMGACILVLGILFITYGLIGEIYADRVADKTWIWHAAMGMIPFGALLRLSHFFIIIRRK